VVLTLLGVVAALAGVALSVVSTCCGSADPAEPGPTVIGFVVGMALATAGVGLWSGRMSRRFVLLCSAVAPAVLLVASAWSADVQGLVPFVALGWLGLWWYLRRPRAMEWLGRPGP
jgi:hypothetical protein